MTLPSESKTPTLNRLKAIAKQFQPSGKITAIRSYGSGNINHTYLVSVAEQAPFILQRLNSRVFPAPELVMQNICILSHHVSQRLQDNAPSRRWEIPQVLLTQDGNHHYLEEDDSFWRALSFIENSCSFDTIQSLDHAQEIGYGLGTFHYLLDDLPLDNLADTLPGFHITPQYLKEYHKLLATLKIAPSPEINHCLQFIRDRLKLPHILENAYTSGQLKRRIIHGDPKINNIMIDRELNQAVAMIDLDTVKPGLIHYDIGDCLRSGCNPWGEETADWSQVKFEPDLAQAILRGYCTVAKHFLQQADYFYIYDSIRLLAFELGLRFFTDHLAGNVYFKIDYPEHNLHRALVQFQLTASVEEQATQIHQIINDLQ